MSKQHHPHASRMLKAVFSKIPQFLRVKNSYKKYEFLQFLYITWKINNSPLNWYQSFKNLMRSYRDIYVEPTPPTMDPG